MREQRADDPSLRPRAVWLGPAGSWRWPVDATFAQWGIGSALTLVFVFLLWLFLPAAVPLALAAWILSRIAARALTTDHRRLVSGGLLWLWFMLCFLAVPSWRAWASPMPLLLALIFAPMIGVLITWRVGKHVTGELPTSYWVSLPGRVARGPRGIPPGTIDPRRLNFIGRK